MLDLSGSAGSAANLQRLTVIAACLGAAVVAVLAPFGYLWLALFGCVGLGLGLLNMALVRRSAVRYAGASEPNKRRFVGAVFGRLALITALAMVLAVLLRPAGLGVFAGLAAFQLLMIGSAALPMIKTLRQSGARA